MKLFFSVGEPSGDLHGANLIAELSRRANVKAVGFGGPRMAAAGCDLLQDMTELAVMGLFPALARLPKFLELLRTAKEQLQADRPDAVVLIDFPGFNWHVAKAAKSLRIPVVYYGLPQVWAWANWRVNKVRRYVDHALVKLPFEEQWFRDRGCNATYVGHPYFDELRTRQLDPEFVATRTSDKRRLVTILPGSRRQEVRANLPTLLKAAELIRRQIPDVRFAIAAYNERQAAMAAEQVAAGKLGIDVHIGRTAELIHAAHTCLACSGSVSLELLYHAKPSVILYKLNPLLYSFVRCLMSTRYITLVNLLATDRIALADGKPYDPHSNDHADVLFPEYPTFRDKSADIAQHAIEWLSDSGAHLALVGRISKLRDQIAVGGASQAAADYILERLTKQPSAVNPPHFSAASAALVQR